MVSSIIRLWPRLSGHCRPPADFRSQWKVVDVDHRERVGAGKVKYHSALSKARSWLWVEIGAMQHAWDIVSISTYIHASIPTKLEILKQTDLFWRRMLMVYATTLGKHGQTISLYGSWRAPILGWKKTGNAWTDLVPLYCIVLPNKTLLWYPTSTVFQLRTLLRSLPSNPELVSGQTW